jgi:hypothetical protein
MRRRHRGAIQTFAIRGAMTAKTITSAVDARHFRTRNATNWKQKSDSDNQSV